jgi:RNA polymerase sigma factor (TIGR02999 family)
MNTHAPEDVMRSPSADEVELSRSEVTRLLSDWNNGDAAALDRLVPLVYEELKRMARQHLRRERIRHTVQTGTLVHEVCLRLIESNYVGCQSRKEFFGIAARLMRRVLVDFARKRGAAKRGWSPVKVSLEDAMALTPEVDPKLDSDFIAIHEALDDLARYDEELVKVVELLYFAGYTAEETAKILGVSTDTVKRRWKKAKIYLLKILTDADGGGDGSATMEKD